MDIVREKKNSSTHLQQTPLVQVTVYSCMGTFLKITIIPFLCMGSAHV